MKNLILKNTKWINGTQFESGWSEMDKEKQDTLEFIERNQWVLVYTT